MLSLSYFVGMKASERQTYFILSPCYFKKAPEQNFFYPNFYDASSATPFGEVLRETESDLIFLIKQLTSNCNCCHLFWRMHCC